MIRLGNKVLKTLTFVEATADAEGSTIALREHCSGELKMDVFKFRDGRVHIRNLGMEELSYAQYIKILK